MQTEAVFENIAERIQQEINKAQKSIYIAVAWFTNKNIFNELLLKAKSGCKVLLIISNDKINLASPIDFDELDKYHSKCFKVGDGESELMHNKFCVIDFSTVITGSYNWSYKAESNFENIIINYNDTALAEQFTAEFNQIKKKFYPEETKAENIFPLNKILKRLDIIKNYVLLEDVKALEDESKKLSEYCFNSEVNEIVTAIENKSYAEAIVKIQNFTNQNQQITLRYDSEIFALRLEIKVLENQLNAYDNEKTEIEKLLNEFQYRHTIELGAIILEILKLRKLKFKNDQQKFEEAEKDYKQYSENLNKEKEKQHFEITDQEKLELKKKFRKASFLCHPDKVSDEFKEAAEKIFIELKTAYEANDLKKVTEILNELEKGNYFKAKSETISEREKLKSAIAKLRRMIKELENEIVTIKSSETFSTIISISDWDEYFKTIKEKLSNELMELQKENTAVNG